MQDLLNETTSKLNDVVIQNGIEVEMDDKEYLNHLRTNHKPITGEILESLEEV